MQIVNLPEPIEMHCYSCRDWKLHAPVVINGDVRYQCTFCGEIMMSAKDTIRRNLDRD